MRQKKRKTSAADKIFVVFNTLFMIVFVVIALYPVLNTLAVSLNDGTDALRGGIYLLPRKWTMKNYVTILQKDNLDHRCLCYSTQNPYRDFAGIVLQCGAGVYCKQKAIFI